MTVAAHIEATFRRQTGTKDIQEPPRLPRRLPQSLIELLAHINCRYLALNQEKTNGTS